MRNKIQEEYDSNLQVEDEAQFPYIDSKPPQIHYKTSHLDRNRRHPDRVLMLPTHRTNACYQTF